ncbi:hypothetical protein [Rathayibacter sp. SD072]|uniref:hypothetical protein n=1 Tax=Rathayibacter sp. SD072 TaxID=2781731 RepID=UPI001A9763A4|nr:hypothetical protein [Rathayibacter sp. SD072]MBO0985861.1 hypothetical protein [Rathayibacter sp. SD072]
MKHISYADKSLLAGDDVVDLLLHYAARLAAAGSADDVDVHVFSSDGDETVATFVLGPGMGIMAEVAHSSMEAPDNSEAIAYLREKLELLDSPPHGGPMDPDDTALDFFYSEQFTPDPRDTHRD